MKGKAVMIRDLKYEMELVRDRWKQQGLDIKVFFDEVLMNIKTLEEFDGEIKWKHQAKLWKNIKKED